MTFVFADAPTVGPSRRSPAVRACSPTEGVAAKALEPETSERMSRRSRSRAVAAPFTALTVCLPAPSEISSHPMILKPPRERASERLPNIEIFTGLPSIDKRSSLQGVLNILFSRVDAREGSTRLAAPSSAIPTGITDSPPP